MWQLLGYFILPLESVIGKLKHIFNLLTFQCGFFKKSLQTVHKRIIAVRYIDLDFTLWLSWLLAPLLITFILPFIIVVLLYTTALILYIYKLHWNALRSAYNANDRWSAARKTVSALWDAHGWIWHGNKFCNTTTHVFK